jgi:hypothetical protein
MTRYCLLRGVAVAAILHVMVGPAAPAEPFPFDQELLLDTAPMPPGKRMPVLNVEPNGNARLDLWCKTVPARLDVSEVGMRIEAAPLPDDLPAMQSAGQCTPERVQADGELLAALMQVTGWRWEGEDVVLEGPKTLKFRRSDH